MGEVARLGHAHHVDILGWGVKGGNIIFMAVALERWRKHESAKKRTFKFNFRSLQRCQRVSAATFAGSALPLLQFDFYCY